MHRLGRVGDSKLETLSILSRGSHDGTTGIVGGLDNSSIFMTSQHNTGTHPFYIGMYIHIYTYICTYMYTSQKECLCIFHKPRKVYLSVLMCFDEGTHL